METKREVLNNLHSTLDVLEQVESDYFLKGNKVQSHMVNTLVGIGTDLLSSMTHKKKLSITDMIKVSTYYTICKAYI